MAISRIIQAVLALVGDGSTTTYALNTETGIYGVLPDMPPVTGGRAAQLSSLLPTASAVVTGVNPTTGETQVQKIPFTVAYVSPTATITFATAPAAGILDYVSIGLVVP